MATLLEILQFFDANGDPLASGKLFWYIAGTSTPKDTYKDQAQSATHTNPIILNADGTIPDGSGGRSAIFLNGSYKLVLKDQNDVEIVSIDDINEYNHLDWTGLTASIADLNSTTTTALLKNANYTVVLGDRNKTLLVTGGTGVDITLPTPAVAGNTFRIAIKKIDSTTGRVEISTPGAETIDDLDNLSLWNYNDSVILQLDGSKWFTISRDRSDLVSELTVSGNITLQDQDRLLAINATAGNVALVLPADANSGRGYKVTIKKIDATSNTVTLTVSGGGTIDGVSSLILSDRYISYELILWASGTWFVRTSYELGKIILPRLPRGYIDSIQISRAADTAHDTDFGVGVARDATDTVNMELTSALIKQIDVSWAAGTNQGGFPSGISITPGIWYHLFLIAKTDGTVDAGYDSSVTAVNLLTDATGYTLYRRVGSVLTDGSSNITNYFMYTGFWQRSFWWIAPPSDSFTSAGTTPVLKLLVTPLAIRTKAILSVNLTESTITYDVAITDPQMTTTGIYNIFQDNSNDHTRAQIEVITDTASKVNMETSQTATDIAYTTMGWYEIISP